MKIFILCGIPGSGKSSFALKYPHYEVINQDTLGDRKACLKVFNEALEANKSVIVDRCNINKLQRSIWINAAKKHNNVEEINCVFLYVTPETSIKRINERKNHATIKETDSIDKKSQIVYNFLSTLEMPEISEGFGKILIIKND